jgi:hypothetical protein
MHYFLDRAAAFGAFFDGPVRELLYLFEFVFALLTLIFVERHSKTPSKTEVFASVILAESRKRNGIRAKRLNA